MTISSVPSLAATGPLPYAWVIAIGDNIIKYGKLSVDNVSTLGNKCGGSLAKLKSIVQRINSYLVTKGWDFRYRLTAYEGSDGNSLWVGLVNISERSVRSYKVSKVWVDKNVGNETPDD
jgi:hypothetical protein